VSYAHAGYAESLAEFGTPRSLPRSGGWLLERQVPDGSARDLVGPYPLFSCSDWEGLQADLDELEGEAVSVVLVADPLTAPGEARLREAFRDRVVPFKPHHVRDLDEAAEPPAHHRRHIRRALGAVEVELCARPLDRLDDWVRLYAGLAARHRLTGMRAFSRASFARQLELPGMVALRALRDGETVGMTLWLADAPRAYYHLAAYSQAGYEVSASYALFDAAFAHLRALGVRLVELGGAERDGLTRFKRGWATGERIAHLCGRVLDRAAYARLAGPSDWFPAYRDPASA
jgi:Acetyltransferase (GNAT) domain